MKAILVVDMPDNCRECRYRCFEASLRDKYRPSWCPLKPMPLRKDNQESVMVGSTEMDIGYILGWNDCLKEIEK